MKGIKEVKKIVESILWEDEKARESDSYLYLRVLEESCNTPSLMVTELNVSTFLLHMNELGAPKFESVRRARQKVQAENPKLSASEKVKEGRLENELIVRDFARGVL